MSQARDEFVVSWRAQKIDANRIGIPTKYRDLVFRSRLEAKWAAFFDLIEWPWEYEPIDLSGYVPDFILRFPRAHLLVEVKPELSIQSLGAHAKKICLSGWRGDFVIVGASLFDGGTYGPKVGRLFRFEHDCPPGEWSPDDAEFHHCLACRRVSLHASDGRWDCLACGAYDGDGYLEAASDGTLQEHWSNATNMVRWRHT